MKPKIGARAALVLLIAYCLDLVSEDFEHERL